MEKKSRRTRRSDLRVSLGRKSVKGLSTLEQASNASTNESCHLNPDSAIIDPDLAANPDWFKHLGQNNSVLVTQNSVNEAILNERDANIINNSNVADLNLSSFDKRQINKILNSSVVVNKAEIEQLTKRKRRVPSEDADSELSEEDNVSLQIPQRRPTTLKRGVPKEGEKSLDAYKAFQAIAHRDSDSDEETEPPVKAKTKSHVSALSASRRESKLHPDKDVSIEIVRKRPAFLKKRKHSSNETVAELHNEFKKVWEQTTDSEGEADVSKQSVPSPSTAAIGSDDISIEIPRRRPNFLKKSSKRDSRKSDSAYNVFKAIANETTDTLGESNDMEVLEPTTATTHIRAKSPADSDVSLEIRRKRPGFLKKRTRKDSSTSQDLKNKFKAVLEQTSGSEGSSDVPEQIFPSTNANEKSNHSKSLLDDVSVEVPKRRPAFMKKRFKHNNSSLDSVNPFENITSGSEEEMEASKENLPSLNRSPSEVEGDVTLPLGAEANNIGDVREDLPTSRKRSLSLKKLRSGNQVDLLSQVIEESSQRSQQPHVDRLKTTDHGNISTVPSNASVTEHTRSAPLRVSHLSQRENFFQGGLTASPNEIRLSEVGENLKLPEIEIRGRDHSLRSEKSIRSNTLLVLSPEQQTSLKSVTALGKDTSMPNNEDIVNTPLSSKAPLATRRASKSFNESAAKDVTSHQANSQRTSQGQGSESDGAASNISSATTVSLPSNITSNLSALISQPTKGMSESILASLTKTGSDSVFVRTSLVRPETEEDSPALTIQNEMGSDSVFSSGITEARRSNMPSHTNEHVKETSHESSWTENPYIDFSHEKGRKEPSEAELEPFEEELSSIDAVDDDDVGADESSSSSVDHNRESRGKSQLKNVPNASPAVSSNLTSKSTSPLSVTPNHVHAMPGTKTTGLEKGALIPSKLKPAPTSKAYDSNYLQKMKLFMENWTKEARSGKLCKPISPKPDTVTFKKPDPKPKPRPSKKKEVCTYLKDYRPPKRVKPKPYVTAKMYKFLEAKLLPKFGLESRIKAEEFVRYMCETVTDVVKKKTKYHKLVFDLRDEMVSLGIIKTQLQFHVFIEDYLPDSFRIKSIPCYGCPKGPKLDSNDLNKDLSVK